MRKFLVVLIVIFVFLVGCKSVPPGVIVGSDYRNAVVHQLEPPFDTNEDLDIRVPKVTELLKSTEIHEFSVNTNNPKTKKFSDFWDEMQIILKTMDVKPGSYGKWSINYLNGNQKVRWYIWEKNEETGNWRLYCFPNF
jgi:hypothetical protein